MKRLITQTFAVCLITFAAKVILWSILKNDIYFSAQFVDELWVLNRLNESGISKLFVYSPGYILFLKSFTMFFDITVWNIIIFQVLVQSLCAGSVFFLLTQICDWKKAFAISLIPLLYIPFSIYALRILPEALWPHFLIISVVSAIIAIDRKDWRYFTFSTFFMVLSSIMRPNLFILVPWFVLIFLFVFEKRKKAIAFLPVIFSFLMIAPVAISNYFETGEFIPLTANSGINFYMGNNERSDGLYKSVEGIRDEIGLQLSDSVKYSSAAEKTDLSLSASSSWWYGKGFEFIVENPEKALDIYLKKLKTLFRNEEFSASFSTDFVLLRHDRLFSFFYGFSFLFASFVFFIFLKLRKNLIFISGTLFFTALGIIPFIIDSRYRLGFSVTVLSFLMTIAAEMNFQKIAESKLRYCVTVLIAVSVFCFTFFPHQKGNVYYAWYSLGNLYVEKSEFYNASESFRKSVEDNSEYKHGWNNLGMSFLSLGDYELGRDAFIKALELDPENEMFRNNLKKAESLSQGR